MTHEFRHMNGFIHTQVHQKGPDGCFSFLETILPQTPLHFIYFTTTKKQVLTTYQIKDLAHWYISKHICGLIVG